MATLAGKSGYIAIGANTNFAFAMWTGDISTDALDTTTFSSGGYKENIAGLTGMKISARGPYNNTAMGLTSGNSYAVTLGMSASVTLTCTARLETISITTDVSKPVEVNISMQSTGSFTAAIV